MVGKGRSQIERDLVTKLGVPEPQSTFSTKTPWWKALCVWRHNVMQQVPLVGEQFWAHMINQLSHTSTTWRYNFWLTVWPGGKKFQCTIRLQSKKQINIVQTSDFDIHAFLGWDEPGDLHQMLLPFCLTVVMALPLLGQDLPVSLHHSRLDNPQLTTYRIPVQGLCHLQC